MSEVTVEKKKTGLSEDWTVVILGALIIIASVFLFVIPTPSWSWGSVEDMMNKTFGSTNVIAIFSQFLLILVIGLIASTLSGKPVGPFLKMLPIVFIITIIAQFIAGNKAIKGTGLEPVIFSLVIGLIIGNLVNLPEWFRSALSTEMFVKIGLVLLGTSVLFKDILQAGGLGLIQALIVVVTVWYFSYWLCRKMKLDEELSLMLSSAVSICGVSAAIATAGAIKGDSKKLSYVISLVLITAIPMMIVMPLIARYFGWSEEMTGAWLGGTIDTTGAVVASGSLVGETALKISTIVKFSQNVLLGVAAFAISIYWTVNGKNNVTEDQKPTGSVIWERFPKFVLGFMGASIIFSFFVSPETAASVKDSLKSIQTLFFVMAFTSIGLETKFADLKGSLGLRPAYAFIIAQLFNVLVTLAVVMVLFG